MHKRAFAASCLFSPAGTFENSPPFQRWESMFGEAQSPGGAKEGHALDFVVPQNPVVWDVPRFSFVPYGTHFVSRSFYPPINRWAIFSRPCGTYLAVVLPYNKKHNLLRDHDGDWPSLGRHSRYLVRAQCERTAMEWQKCAMKHGKSVSVRQIPSIQRLISRNKACSFTLHPSRDVMMK